MVFAKFYIFSKTRILTDKNKSSGTREFFTWDGGEKLEPTNVTALTATAGDGQVTLSWTNPTDADFSSVKITMTPAEGDLTSPLSLSNGETSYTVKNLTNDKTYTFTVAACDKSGNFSSGVTTTATPKATGSTDTDDPKDPTDTTAPTNVTKFVASPADGQVTLSWTNPADADFDGVTITMTPAAGDLATAKTIKKSEIAYGSTGLATYTVTGLTNGTEYTFTIVSVDASGNKSEGEVIKASPVVPPEVTDLQIESSSSGNVKLSWTNPADDKITGIELSYVKSDWSKQDSVTLGKDETSYTFADMEKGQTYTFTVKTKYSDSNKSEGVSKTITTKSYCEITTKAVDEGIKVTIKMLEDVYFKDNGVTENTTGLMWGYGEKDSVLFTNKIYSIVFPFTERDKEYSFKIAGWVVDKTDGKEICWYDETLSTCTATVTTEAGKWYANNMDYFTDYNIDCGYNAETEKFEAYRLFKQLDGITDADAQKAKVKNIMKSVINAKPDSVAKVSAYFYKVLGDVNWSDNTTKWVGAGEKELSYDEAATYEQKETVSFNEYDVESTISIRCGSPYNGRYGAHHHYNIYIGSGDDQIKWETTSRPSSQKYYYVEKAGTGSAYTTKTATRVLHAVYDNNLSQYQKNSRYLVKDDETKDVAVDTTLKELAKSYEGYEAETLIQADNYLAVLYKAIETTPAE